jgi:hypothetical protein
MSLAMYAAPFNNDNNEDNNNNNFVNETAITKKRNLHNKTQKRNDYNSPKVNAVLESIHSSSHEENDLGDFKPLGPPTSMGVENTKIREGMSNNSQIQANETDNVDLKTLQNNFLNDKAVEKYYQNLIPTYNHNNIMNMNNHPNNNHQNYITTEANKPYYPINYNLNSNSNNNMEKENENYSRLVEKLNYMINLLEEQQDERTNNVTEEVVLYSFLGIFIIFIVDSFARVGKYVR